MNLNRAVVASLTLSIALIVSAQAQTVATGPVFACSFESKAEVSKLKGSLRSNAKFVPGIKGNAVDSDFVFFPSEKTIPVPEGTMSMRVRPHWDMTPDMQKYKSRLICCLNNEQEKKPDYHYNYFCILGHAFGDLKKGQPFRFYILARKSASKPRQESLLLMAPPPKVAWKKDVWVHVCITWRINNEQKDGLMALYLDGKEVGMLKGFQAHKLDLGKRLQVSPDAVMDEFKVWNRVLSADEIKVDATRPDQK